MECSKCIHFKQLEDEEYTCKYLKEESVHFCGDSVATAESCDYYKEKQEVSSHSSTH